MKLIDKNKLLEGLKNLKQNLSASPIVVIEDVESLVENLEVKEVDLEKEIHSWMEDNTCRGYCSASIRDTAEHFFELGLKVKEESDCIYNQTPKLNNCQITIGTKIRLKTNPDLILSIISNDCHEDKFECSNGSVLSLKQIEKYYDII